MWRPAASVLGKNDPFLLGYSHPREVPRLRPQAKGTEGDIIPAEGGLLGSRFVSKVGSFLASAEGQLNPTADPLVSTKEGAGIDRWRGGGPAEELPGAVFQTELCEKHHLFRAPAVQSTKGFRTPRVA